MGDVIRLTVPAEAPTAVQVLIRDRDFWRESCLEMEAHALEFERLAREYRDLITKALGHD